MNEPATVHTRRPAALILFFALLIAASILAALVSMQWMTPDNWARHDEPHGHAWLQKELNLTDAEATAIDQFEEPYRSQRAHLLKQFDARVGHIAELLQESDAITPEVRQAIHELHIVHGQLQELSIEHYFDMLSVLPAEKQEKLRQLAADALSTPE